MCHSFSLWTSGQCGSMYVFEEEKWCECKREGDCECMFGNRVSERAREMQEGRVKRWRYRQPAQIQCKIRWGPTIYFPPPKQARSSEPGVTAYGERGQEILSCIVLPPLNNAAGILCVRSPLVNSTGDVMVKSIESICFWPEVQIRSLVWRSEGWADSGHSQGELSLISNRNWIKGGKMREWEPRNT